MEPDGRFVLLGRDSLVVNTGGEKVFVEEVEDALKQCDGVADVIVVGRSEPALRPGGRGDRRARPGRHSRTRVASATECGERIARYKAPRAFLFVEQIRRHPSGKADYAWARERSADALAVT